MKYFIITIDVEGDNLWDYRLDDDITTKNAKYLPRFQKLCEKYEYKPVYLVNFEMANDAFFTDFARKTVRTSNCEIGLHLHAWNTPPHYKLAKSCDNYGLPYLIEYPETIMREKFNFLFKQLTETFDIKIMSHRAGRWAMDQRYFDLLIDSGIKIDCSVTPHISWKKSKGFTAGSTGSDYNRCSEDPFVVKRSLEGDFLLETPVTIRILHNFFFTSPRTVLSDLKRFICGKPVWLRPNGNNLREMLALIEYIKKSNDDYLMFMLHSSEFMPGGSPNFKTEESIERLYADIRIIFENIHKNFQGITLKNYYEVRSS
ncbi:MAG: hypothetical protein LBE13_21955 [Bacteroidales bacterium]|jgi:hypothetical protein|nr:hypothetical protein [Bacteroidales bacterium]